MAALYGFLFFLFVVGLFESLLTQPAWSMQWTASLVILLGVIFRFVAYCRAHKITRPQPSDAEHTTGEPEFDDPMNISPAERIRRLEQRTREEIARRT